MKLICAFTCCMLTLNATATSIDLSSLANSVSAATLSVHSGDRILQHSSMECEDQYESLWQDTDLQASYSLYKSSFSTGNDPASIVLDEYTCSGKKNIYCNIDNPINGESRFLGACDNAGGEFFVNPMDVKCILTRNGNSGSILLDVVDIRDCLPPSDPDSDCTNVYTDGINDLSLYLSTTIEALFVDAGFENVVCEVGEVEKIVEQIDIDENISNAKFNENKSEDTDGESSAFSVSWHQQVAVSLIASIMIGSQFDFI